MDLKKKKYIKTSVGLYLTPLWITFMMDGCTFWASKLCFINKVREEHIQLINKNGVHSTINEKRCID